MHFYLLEIARKGANDKEFKKITQMCRRYVKNLEYAETEDLPVKKTRVRRFGGGKKATAPEVSMFFYKPLTILCITKTYTRYLVTCYIAAPSMHY